MNWSQFKVSVGHMCVAGAVVASWSLMQQVAGLSLFIVMTNIFWKLLGKTQLTQLVLLFRGLAFLRQLDFTSGRILLHTDSRVKTNLIHLESSRRDDVYQANSSENSFCWTTYFHRICVFELICAWTVIASVHWFLTTIMKHHPMFELINEWIMIFWKSSNQQEWVCIEIMSLKCEC